MREYLDENVIGEVGHRHRLTRRKREQWLSSVLVRFLSCVDQAESRQRRSEVRWLHHDLQYHPNWQHVLEPVGPRCREGMHW